MDNLKRKHSAFNTDPRHPLSEVYNEIILCHFTTWLNLIDVGVYVLATSTVISEWVPTWDIKFSR